MESLQGGLTPGNAGVLAGFRLPAQPRVFLAGDWWITSGGLLAGGLVSLFPLTTIESGTAIVFRLL